MFKIFGGFLAGLGVVGYCAIIALWAAMVIGWIMNIFKIFGDDFVIESVKGVLRLVGIVLAPLGGVMGWL